MAAWKEPIATTASTCTPETAPGKHVFKIDGYSLHKGLGVGKFIRSATFAVGGYDWCIRYYPDGDSTSSVDLVSVFLELMTKNAEVRAGYEFRLINLDIGLSSIVFSKLAPPSMFNSFKASENKHTWGTTNFKKKSDLEASPYLRDDSLVIECEVNVTKEPRVEMTTLVFEFPMPPSDLSDNLRKLLEMQEEADVKFKVQGQVFPAHKIVLAMRSPVFKAELYGPMRGESKPEIAIEDMQPAVFKAMLYFIYTDSLPSMDDLDGDENKKMITHLLVAADRYAMERMKMICEGILSKSLDVENVATTLALADQHHCSRLKDACIQFIASSNRMGDVVASQGYAHLKRSCPVVLGDILETVTKYRKL